MMEIRGFLSAKKTSRVQSHLVGEMNGIDIKNKSFNKTEKEDETRKKRRNRILFFFSFYNPIKSFIWVESE